MKNVSRIVSALFLLMILSCTNTENPPEPSAESSLVKLLFQYTDGTTDQSRIINIQYLSELGSRTTQNITIDSETTIEPGEYGVIEVKNGAKIRVSGLVNVGNINFNNNHDVNFDVTSAGELNLNSSLNLNGKVRFTNRGKLSTGNVELQSGNNEFFNYGTHNVNGDLQISSGDSQYNNCGFLNVSNYTNFHSGRYHSCDCGQLVTNGLNVNGSKKVSGKGFIKVTGNLNLNGFLTDSPDIEFCYKGHLNNPEKLGAAKCTCEPSCKPDPMPVRYTNLKAETFKSPEGIKGRISFMVTENSNLLNMKIMVSSDGKKWKEQLSETEAAFKVGQEYIGVFSLK